MSNTIILLDKARATVPRQSKSALALTLGIERGNLGRMYRGKGYPNALQTARLAKVLKMDAEEVAAMIQVDKARSPATKEEALRHSPRLSPALGIAVALVAGVFGNAKSEAAPVGETPSAHVLFTGQKYTLCEVT